MKLPPRISKAASPAVRATALMAALLLTSCVVPPPREQRPPPVYNPPPVQPPPHVPPPYVPPTPPPVSSFCPQPPLPPAARGACPQNVRPIGVLAVVSNTVCRNNHHAVDGERVCENDQIITSPSGIGEVLPDGDGNSDSVHVAEGTDPRFTWTQGGCLHVDNYRYGRIVVTTQSRCVVIRTPDTLMLLASGRVQLQVFRNNSTQVIPLRGSLTKLQPLSAQQVYALAPSQLAQYAAPPALQPQMQSTSIYANNRLVQPAVRVPPMEIRRIDESVQRRAIMVPQQRVPQQRQVPPPDIR